MKDDLNQVNLIYFDAGIEVLRQPARQMVLYGDPRHLHAALPTTEHRH